MLKLLRWIAIGVLVVVLVGVMAVRGYLNSVVRDTVESQTKASLNLPTQVGSAQVSLFGGSLSLGDFNIGSPSGFGSPTMFGLKDVSVKVDYGQLTEDPIRIQSISLEAPTLVLEQRDGKFNLKTALDNMPPAETAPPGEEAINLVIDSLKVNSARVIVKPNLPGLAPEYAVTVPSIELKGIGTGEGAQNGAAIRDVMVQVATELANEAAKSDQLPENLRTVLSADVNAVIAKAKEELQRQIDEVGGKIRERISGEVGKVLGDGAGQDAGKAISDGVGQQLQGILGGNKKE